MMVGPWLPVQLNVTRPRRREAMRRSIFHTILGNLEGIQLVSLEFSQEVDIFGIDISMDGSGRNLMGIIRERAIYVDMSKREEGQIVFAIDGNYLDKIKNNIAIIDGIDIQLIDE